MLSQHDTQCSDEALSGAGVSSKVLQHGHVVQSRGRERMVRKQLEKELRKNRGKCYCLFYFFNSVETFLDQEPNQSFSPLFAVLFFAYPFQEQFYLDLEVSCQALPVVYLAQICQTVIRQWLSGILRDRGTLIGKPQLCLVIKQREASLTFFLPSGRHSFHLILNT